jgi:AraC family transcriptional regulator
MKWNMLYDRYNWPDPEDISKYVKNELWEKLNLFLKDIYKIRPEISYSRCSMQPEWNLKYKKNGKSLCTLYPVDGFFIALVVVGKRESAKVEMIFSSLSNYVQKLYRDAVSPTGYRWLMINITDEKILSDLIRLIRTKLIP